MVELFKLVRLPEIVISCAPVFNVVAVGTVPVSVLKNVAGLDPLLYSVKVHPADLAALEIRVSSIDPLKYPAPLRRLPKSIKLFGHGIPLEVLTELTRLLFTYVFFVFVRESKVTLT